MNTNNKKYMGIVSHLESCLERYGDNHLGVDWPNLKDATTRYKIMLEVIQQNTSCDITLLDFGCGASHLYEYVIQNKLTYINYSGLDLSEKFINLSKSKFPHNQYYYLDILDKEVDLPVFDYVVMNGVFTEKVNLSFEDMLDYFQLLICEVFKYAKVGIAFNAMSKQVDWERDDLFHLPLDVLASFLTKEISRNFIIRNDYGLYEYTTYIYK